MISEREEYEGVTNMEQEATVLLVVQDGRTGDTETKQGWLSTFVVLRALVKGRGCVWVCVDACCLSSCAMLQHGGCQNEFGRLE